MNFNAISKIEFSNISTALDNNIIYRCIGGKSYFSRLLTTHHT